MADFPKKQQQCLIPKYLLEYATDLQENHPDPSAEWGGGSSYTAGTGISIADDIISVNSDVAMKTDLATVATTGDYDDLSDKPVFTITLDFSKGNLQLSDDDYNLIVANLHNIDLYVPYFQEIYTFEGEQSDYYMFKSKWSGATGVTGNNVITYTPKIYIYKDYKVAARDVQDSFIFKVDKTTMNLNPNNNVISTVIGGGNVCELPTDSSQYSLVSGGAFDGFYKTTDTTLRTAFCNYEINLLKSGSYSGRIEPNASFTTYDSFIVRSDNGETYANYEIQVDVASDGNTVTISQTSYPYTSISVSQFTFDFTTGAYVALPSEMYIEPSVYNYIANNSSVRFVFNQPWTGLYEQVDSKYIPIDNSTIVVDANGKLSAVGSGDGYSFENYTLGSYIGSASLSDVPNPQYSGQVGTPAYLGSIDMQIGVGDFGKYVCLFSEDSTTKKVKGPVKVQYGGWDLTCTLPDNTQVTAKGYYMSSSPFNYYRLYVYSGVNNYKYNTGKTYFWIASTHPYNTYTEKAILTTIPLHDALDLLSNKAYFHSVKCTGTDSNSNNVTLNLFIYNKRSLNLGSGTNLNTELSQYMQDNTPVNVTGYLDNGQPILLGRSYAYSHNPGGLQIFYYDTSTSTVVSSIISTFSNITDTIIS